MKKLLMTLICVMVLCGCSSKKDDNVQSTPTPETTPGADENTSLLLGEMLPESIQEIRLEIETSTETITIEFKDDEVAEVLNQMRSMVISEDFVPYEGSGAKEYRIIYTDDEGIVHEMTEQGNVLKLSDGTKTGPEGNIGLIHNYVMMMDWVIEISDYEMLTPLRVETEDYVITCAKGKTSVYDLAYLNDVGFDPFELGFTVTVDGTDTALDEMPVEGDYLLILSKDNASYQLKVTSTVK